MSERASSPEEVGRIQFIGDTLMNCGTIVRTVDKNGAPQGNLLVILATHQNETPALTDNRVAFVEVVRVYKHLNLAGPVLQIQGHTVRLDPSTLIRQLRAEPSSEELREILEETGSYPDSARLKPLLPVKTAL